MEFVIFLIIEIFYAPISALERAWMGYKIYREDIENDEEVLSILDKYQSARVTLVAISAFRFFSMVDPEKSKEEQAVLAKFIEEVEEQLAQV